ncbi:cell wall-binding repeat-containing protein [Mobiluncus mulieris]|nr:cell wall-binding repeat-containing protein [Mobiluncus mulieris]
MTRKNLLACLLSMTLGVITLGMSNGTALALDPPSQADRAAAPWIAQVAVMDSRDRGFTHCTGSMVAPQWVLTARHCVESPVLSEAYIDIGPGPSYRYPYRITSVVKHPHFDVALLKLNQNLNTPTLDIEDSLPVPGTTAEFFGFGGANVLTQTTLKILGTGSDKHLFARSLDGTKSVVGDSGGPLIANNKLLGILTAAVYTPYETFAKEDFKFVPTPRFSEWLLVNLGITPAKKPAKPQPASQPAAPKPSAPNQPTAPTKAAHPAAPNRIAGTNRVQTSLAVWNLGGFITDSVVIATGKHAPDALAAGPLAAALNAPLVLSVAPTIETEIAAKILNRGIKQVYLVGGGLNFNPNIQSTLGGRGVKIIQLAGANRYQTATIVANTAIAKWNLQGRFQNPILVADGLNFPDALSAGASAANLHGVVVLSAGTAMPKETADFIAARAGAKPQIFAVGGPAYLAWNSSRPGGIPAAGIVGANRYQTAALLAANLNPNTTSALVVSGADFPDGLAAAPLAARRNSRLLLTTPGALPPDSANSLGTLTRRQASLVIGGRTVISDTVAWQVRGNAVS